MSERNIVTTGQIFILLFISRISLSIVYSVFVSGISSLWELFIPLLISMIIIIVMLLPVNYLYRRNKGLSVCNFALELFGKFGNIIPILYIIYFFLSSVYLLMTLNHFLNIILPDDIHSKAVLSVLIAACIYASLKGIESLSRMSAVVLGLLLLSSALMAIFLIKGFSSDNILPIEYVTVTSVIDGTAFIISRMNSVSALNVLTPSIKGNLLKSSLIWSISVILFMCFMLVLFRGSTGDYLNFRELSVYQAIEGAGSLQRLNPFFIFVNMCSIFCNISLLMFSMAECTKNLFSKSKRKIIPIISGMILLGMILILPDDSRISILFNKYIWFVLTVIFTSVIPLMILAVLKMRELKPKFKGTHKTIRTALLMLVLSLFISVTMSSCNSIQLNQRLIVQGIGIDRNTDGYIITLIVLDTENEDKENSVKLVYTTGKTTDEALSKLENQRGKKLLLSQCLFVMMNKSAADVYDRTLSYFTEVNEMQKTVNLMVTENSAKDTITEATGRLGYQSEYINVLADSKAVNQTEVHCSLTDCIISLRGIGTSMLFPYIIINDDISALSVNGSYLVDRGGSYYHMTSEETIGTLIVNKKVSDYTDTISTENGEINYKIDNVHTNIVPTVRDNSLNIDFNIQVYLDREYDSGVMKEITESIYEKVKSGIDKTLLKSGSDVFSLNKYIRSAYPEFYKKTANWKELLKKSVTHTTVKCY